MAIKQNYMQKERLFLNFDRSITTCLCILIFCLPFAKAMVGIFTGLAAFLWILKRLFGYRTEGLLKMIPKTDLNKVLGIYLLVNIISVVFSVDYGLSLKGFFTKDLKFIVIFLMIIEVISNNKRLKSILFTIAASAVLMTADAIFQYLRGVDFIRGYNLSAGITASFSNANGFAGWLLIIIPLCLGLLISDKIRSKAIKLFLLILSLLLMFFLLLTFSLGAWLGFAITFFIMACHALIKAILNFKTLHLFLGVYILVILLLLLYPFKTKFESIGNMNFKSKHTLNEVLNSTVNIRLHDSNFIRINILKESLQIIKDYPLFGCGLNTYSKVVKNYKTYYYGGIYPHNSFLQKAAETGLPGILAFFLVLFSFFITSLRHIFLHANKNNTLVVGLLAGISAFLVHSFFDNNLYALQLVVLFWFMMGLTMAVINIERVSSQQQS